MRQIGFLDTTLRDGQQSLWATRMTTEMMEPFFRPIALSGVRAIDLIGLIQFDVAVRYLHEDPWQRIRSAREHAGSEIKLSGGIRSRSLTGFAVVPDDVLDLWVRNYVVNGVSRITAFDPLFLVDNVSDTLQTATELGADAVAMICFTVSPVHTDQFFVDHIVALHAKSPLDSIVLKDPSGILTPERARTLVPAIKAAIPKVPLEIHSHCMTGLAPYVYLAAVEAGADVIHTAISPLANGSSQPDSIEIAENLREMGFGIDLDIDQTRTIAQRLRHMALARGKPFGHRLPYRVRHFGHQMPGGMITNLQSQLVSRGMEHRLEDVLDECARIREELAWPIMVTPFAQLVATQAVINISAATRYAVVPDELKMYVLGNYGPPVAEIDQNVKDRIVTNNTAKIGEGLLRPPPALPKLRRDHPAADDNELLLRFAFPGHLVDSLDMHRRSADFSNCGRTADVRRSLGGAIEGIATASGLLSEAGRD